MVKTNGIRTVSRQPAMTFEDYLADRSCSPSVLRDYARNPVTCLFKKRETEALKQGTAFHAVMDGSYKELYMRGPEGPCNKNPGAAELKRLKAENPTRIVLPAKKYDGYIEMSDSIYLHPKIGPLMNRVVEREVSYFWYDEEDVPCKARPDAVTSDGIILDFKTTASIGVNWWRDAHKLQYDLSVGHYLDPALPFTGYVFIVVSKDIPYFAMKWELSHEAMQDARLRVMELRKGWNESRLKGHFENIYDREYLIPKRSPNDLSFASEEAEEESDEDAE